MGLFRGAAFHHGGGARKQHIKQPTEMPTSTMALMGRFPSLMGRFPTLMGSFPDFILRGFFTCWKSTGKQSETGRIRFRRVRFQTPNSVSFFALTEFRGENSVSSSQPIICVPKRTHRVFSELAEFAQKLSEAQWVLFSETVLSKQYSARFLNSPLRKGALKGSWIFVHASGQTSPEP